jgi:type II secretory pathway component PulF
LTEILNLNTPYEAPRSVVSEVESVHGRHGILFWLVSIAATLLSVLIGIMEAFVMPAFMGVYSSFGANLPELTLWFVNYRNWLWCALGITATLWAVWWKSRSQIEYRAKVRLGFVILLIANIVVIWVQVWAMYLPIFKLGTTVS